MKKLGSWMLDLIHKRINYFFDVVKVWAEWNEETSSDLRRRENDKFNLNILRKHSLHCRFSIRSSRVGFVWNISFLFYSSEDNFSQSPVQRSVLNITCRRKFVLVEPKFSDCFNFSQHLNLNITFITIWSFVPDNNFKLCSKPPSHICPCRYSDWSDLSGSM